MNTAKPAKEIILDLLKEKSVVKNQLFRQMIDVFRDLNSVLIDLADEYAQSIRQLEHPLVIEYREKSEFEAELKVAGDTLIFHMHTNIFNFDKSHSIWNSSYVKDQPQRSFCGVINIYNFLSDSFKYNRVNDSGYLVARIFINKEHHYFVEGKRQLGFLYNDFHTAILDAQALRSIVESAIIYSLDFDLLTPSYDAMKEVTVHEMQELARNMQLKTAKRLGFRFQADTDNIEG